MGSSAVAAGADAASTVGAMVRPQLLYLLLALTRVAGAWDALLADDGTIDLGGNVVAVAEDPDDPVAVPGNLGVQPTVRSQPGPGSMWGAHMA